MTHRTKEKGDLAVIKTIADLASKGFKILIPVACEHLRFDLVGYRDGKFTKFQCKYSTSGDVKNKTCWNSSSGSHSNKYQEGDFDYYAVYLPDKDVICYPSFTFGNIGIRTEIQRSATPFYWFKDFLDLTDEAKKRYCSEFGLDPIVGQPIGTVRLNQRKVARPSRAKLKELLWSKPTTVIAKDLGVSDKAIEKWAKTYKVKKPPRGYWKKHPRSNSEGPKLSS